MDTHPNPLSDTDQRLTELEIKASYSEDLLEQLNMTIYRQQLQIDALLHELHAALGLTMIMVTHDLDTLFSLSSRVAVLAQKRVLVSGPAQEVAAFDHPFIHQFFQGERGRRAMAPATAVKER